MAFKYDKPEWKRAPVAAQINEALREVEQVKAALMSLRAKAAQLDEFFQQRRAFLKQRVGKQPKPQDAASLQKAETTMGNWSFDVAKGDLARLDGWMKSLIESEIALNSLLSPGFSGPALNFGVKREQFVRQEAGKWPDRLFSLLSR